MCTVYLNVLHTACTSVDTIPFSFPQPTETVEGGPFHNPDMCVSCIRYNDPTAYVRMCIPCVLHILVYLTMQFSQPQRSLRHILFTCASSTAHTVMSFSPPSFLLSLCSSSLLPSPPLLSPLPLPLPVLHLPPSLPSHPLPLPLPLLSPLPW